MKRHGGGWKLTVSCATNTSPTQRIRRTALVRGCIAILCVGSLTACTVQASCDLYNNSGSELTIVRSKGGEEQPPIHLKPGESILISDWRFSAFRVDQGGVVSRYALEAPPTDFVVNRGFGPWAKRIFRAQMNAGGQIFLLKPDQPVPAKEFVDQPNGFPLVPIVNQ
jgi:hypothetical protein